MCSRNYEGSAAASYFPDKLWAVNVGNSTSARVMGGLESGGCRGVWPACRTRRLAKECVGCRVSDRVEGSGEGCRDC